MEGHAGWGMASLRFESGYWLWRGMLVGKWLALDFRGYWLWRGILVGKWLVLDLSEETGCGGAFWLKNS